MNPRGVFGLLLAVGIGCALLLLLLLFRSERRAPRLESAAPESLVSDPQDRSGDALEPAAGAFRQSAAEAFAAPPSPAVATVSGRSKNALDSPQPKLRDTSLDPPRLPLRGVVRARLPEDCSAADLPDEMFAAGQGSNSAPRGQGLAGYRPPSQCALVWRPIGATAARRYEAEFAFDEVQIDIVRLSMRSLHVPRSRLVAGAAEAGFEGEIGLLDRRLCNSAVPVGAPLQFNQASARAQPWHELEVELDPPELAVLHASGPDDLNLEDAVQGAAARRGFPVRLAWRSAGRSVALIARRQQGSGLAPRGVRAQRSSEDPPHETLLRVAPGVWSVRLDLE